MTKKFHIINGPNLNLLGQREPSIYGSGTLKDLEDYLLKLYSNQDINISFFQSNYEGALVEKIHDAIDSNGIIINAGAYTHTSIAIRDALAAVKIPFVEVHLSNVYAREDFRHHSYLSSLAQAVICGMGFEGYRFAIAYLIKESGFTIS